MNMLTSNIRAGTGYSGLASTGNKKQSQSSDTPQVLGQQADSKNSNEQFNFAFGEKQGGITVQQILAGKKTVKPTQNTDAISTLNLAQLLASQRVAAENGLVDIGVTTTENFQQPVDEQTAQKIAQLVAESETLKSPSVKAPGEQAGQEKTGEIVSDILGSKPADTPTVDPVEMLAQPIMQKTQVSAETANTETVKADISEELALAQSGPEAPKTAEITEKAQTLLISDTVSKENIVTLADSQELPAKRVIAGSTDNIVEQKAESADKAGVLEIPRAQGSTEPIPAIEDKSVSIQNKTGASGKGDPEVTEVFGAGTDAKGQPEDIAARSVTANGPVVQGVVSEVQSQKSSGLPGSKPAVSAIEPDIVFVAGDNSQVPVAEQVSVSAENRIGVENSAGMREQIEESIQTTLQAGEREVVVRLNPPELGRVTIRFQERGNEIIGLFEVSKPETRVEIQQSLPQIMRDLADCGVQIKRIEVVMTNDQQQPSSKEQSTSFAQQEQAGQQGSSNSDMHPNYPGLSGINEWLTGTDGYWDASNSQYNFATEDSINMLA
ncbi:flagellar hook-length control protein FliK [Planctomycetota bacterium]